MCGAHDEHRGWAVPRVRRRVALATCAEVGLDADDVSLPSELEERGIEATSMVWDDHDADWSSFELVVVRSTWDYAGRREEYLAWARHVESVATLANPEPVLAWSTDKRYLAELEGAGIPVVPTTFFAPGSEVELPEDAEFVVKPVISAGSRDTARYAPDERDRAQEHAQRLLHTGRHVMVQPYLHQVDTDGETALLYLDGVFSHAVRKGPLLRPGAPASTDKLYVPEVISPRAASPDQRALADRVIGALPFASLLYARVDMIGTDDGHRVLEVERAEPSLFLELDQDAAGRLADGIAARLETAAGT